MAALIGIILSITRDVAERSAALCYIFRTVRALSRARAFCRDLSARPRVLYTFPILRATAKLRRAREQRNGAYWKYARP